jgi:hypothetical protein
MSPGAGGNPTQEVDPWGYALFEHSAATAPSRKIVMVLEAVYQQDFLPCSFGFRPARSACRQVTDGVICTSASKALP